jgi:hypothetical protein
MSEWKKPNQSLVARWSSALVLILLAIACLAAPFFVTVRPPFAIGCALGAIVLSCAAGYILKDDLAAMTPAPKRRWFQFSLRALFWLITISAIGAGVVVTEHRERIRLESENALCETKIKKLEADILMSKVENDRLRISLIFLIEKAEREERRFWGL